MYRNPLKLFFFFFFFRTVEAISCMEQAVNLFCDIGRLSMAARYLKVHAYLVWQDCLVKLLLNNAFGFLCIDLFSFASFSSLTVIDCSSCNYL